MLNGSRIIYERLSPVNIARTINIRKAPDASRNCINRVDGIIFASQIVADVFYRLLNRSDMGNDKNGAP